MYATPGSSRISASRADKRGVAGHQAPEMAHGVLQPLRILDSGTETVGALRRSRAIVRDACNPLQHHIVLSVPPGLAMPFLHLRHSRLPATSLGGCRRCS